MEGAAGMTYEKSKSVDKLSVGHELRSICMICIIIILILYFL